MKKLWRKIAALGMAAVMTLTAAPAVNVNAATTAYSGDLDRISKGRYTDGTSTEIIWVNGKDTAAAGDRAVSKWTKTGSYFKTAIFRFVGKTLGSKLRVAVLPEGTTDGDIALFAALFQENGRLSPVVERAGREYAGARIDQNGLVSVSAKRKSGKAEIWVYEFLDREPVWYGDHKLGQGYGIDPVYAEVEIRTAPSTITYTTDPSKLTWGSEKGQGAVLKKSDGSLQLQEGDRATVYLADKKTPVDLQTGYPCYVVEENYDSSVIRVDQESSFEGGYLRDGFPDRFVITAGEKGKTTITVQSPISGKKVKIRVIVK